MPLYEYRFIDVKGKKASNWIEAENLLQAKEKLRERGLLLLRIQEKAQKSSRQQLKGEALVAFTIQLSQLVTAGLPLFESLQAIEEQMRGEASHAILEGLCDKVKAGRSLSSAMGDYPNSFDRLYCGMVAAGEAVGGLGAVLEKLTLFLKRQEKLKKQISTALIYPAILGGFSCLIIGVLLGFVIPSLEGIFADRKLNGFTEAILWLSFLFRNYWWLYLPVGIGSVFLARWYLLSDRGRFWWQKTLLRIPFLRTLAMQASFSRFCRTLSTLLMGGVSMIESLQIARGVMHNQVLEREMAQAEEKVVQGKALSQELARSRYIPKLVPRMLAVGEESGTSPYMLSSIAELYEQDLEKSLDRITALIQPVVLIIMGIVIGAVLLAILLPLTDVGSFSMNG